MEKTVEDQVRELLIPILNVFGGADGGVAYARLQHDFLRGLYAKEDPSELEQQLKDVVQKFSRLCQVMLDS